MNLLDGPLDGAAAGPGGAPVSDSARARAEGEMMARSSALELRRALEDLLLTLELEGLKRIPLADGERSALGADLRRAMEALE